MPGRPAVRLRRARDADGPVVVALVRRALREHGLRFDPAGIDRPLSAPASCYRGPGRRFWVLEAGGRVVGTAAVDRQGRGTCELMKRSTRCGSGVRGRLEGDEPLCENPLAKPPSTPRTWEWLSLAGFAPLRDARELRWRLRVDRSGNLIVTDH